MELPQNMMKDSTPTKSVQLLIKAATAELHNEFHAYSDRTMEYIECTWRQFLAYCDSHGISEYQSDISNAFLDSLRNTNSSFKPATIARKAGSMTILDLFSRNGTWVKGKLHPKPDLEDEFSLFLEKQDSYLKKYDYSDNTRLTTWEQSYAIFLFFQNFGLKKLNEISREHITSYIMSLKGHARSTLRCELSRLRRILHYAYLCEFTADDLSSYVPTYNLGQSQSNVKIWESDEIDKVLDAVDRANPVGKRDAAFITIASEYGMRSKEICDLKISDLDWEACSISFSQCKTRKANALPLSEKAGSAIIDYLRVRPDTECEYLFIDFNPPYDKMKSFNSKFIRYVQRSGVTVPINAHHGLHSLRATVVTKLLDADVSPDEVFSFVGHSNRESLNNYIRMDTETLRECALSFEDGELI